MAEPEQLNNPWLVAAWPGIGAVAANAGLYLVQQLGAKLVTEIPSHNLFEVQQIDVQGGIARASRLPRNMVFEWRDPRGQRDLLIFVSEAQPQHGGYGLCQKIIEYGVRRGVGHIVTFAAMATQLHPSTAPRVFGAVTQSDLLPELMEHNVEILKEGQISGLNGVLLAAGADRGLPGVCLLGELPFFAVAVPNPRASQAVLEVFSSLSDIHIDLTEIQDSAREAEGQHLELLEQLKDAAREQAENEQDYGEQYGDDSDDEVADDDVPSIDDATRRRIEVLFERASEDRGRAFELKAMLDRYGVFEQYEDRFLDLFKKAE
jgi:hypothetical protein